MCVLKSCYLQLIKIKSSFKQTNLKRLVAHCRTMESAEIDKAVNIVADSNEQIISEGLALIKTFGNVFYNPVQEFNRDLSIAVLSVFAKERKLKNVMKSASQKTEPEDKSNDNIISAVDIKLGSKCEEGITILEALAATGLRSIRYAKEIPYVKQITANDISYKAVETMKLNIEDNGVKEIVTASKNDATMLMYQHRQREDQFDAIDLDPYGCPSTFLDSALQAVKDGGLLLVTATDMAVLAGNSPETCYSKYGAISLRLKSCHEMALRILLQCIESHANRYGRYIEPMLSISADFYIRVFVKVCTGPNKCKYTLSKLSTVYHCTGCDSFTLQPLGILKTSEKKQVKFGLPTELPVKSLCEHCGHSFHVGGPVWSGPLHSPEFVQEVLHIASSCLGTYKRIQGVLNVINEELLDCPLYYTLERLCGTLHVECPPMLDIRSALLNAGYRVSFAHMNKTSIKTNAPSRVIWDIMRCWVAKHPVSCKRLIKNSPATNILAISPEKEYSFKMHPDANPESRKMGFVRFQANPLPHWGPGTRATAMVGDEKISKRKRNQGKRKREHSEETVT